MDLEFKNDNIVSCVAFKQLADTNNNNKQRQQQFIDRQYKQINLTVGEYKLTRVNHGFRIQK